MNKKIIFGTIFFIISFIAAQAAVYFLSKSNFFKSPTYVLMPIFGFFSLYLITPIIINDLKINKFVFASMFVVFCGLGYLFALLFYNYNIYVILNNLPLVLGYFEMLFKSSFFSFMIAGTLGIIFNK